MRHIFFILLALSLVSCSNSSADARRADILARRSEQLHRQAESAYQRALRLMPEGKRKEQLRFKAGLFHYTTGAYLEAVAVLRSASDPRARRLLAQALTKSGDITGALEAFNKAGLDGPADYLYDYGQTLEKSNLYDQALKIYARVLPDKKVGPSARQRIETINLTSGKAAFAGLAPMVRDLIANSPGQEAYPQASALILLSDENITLTDDHRLVSDLHYVIKILNDRGKEAYGEVSLSYDATYEKCDVVVARTIKPDGTVVTVGDKNIRDVSLYLNFPMYSNARARIISMPEVSRGSVIEYRVTITQSQLPNKKDFDTVYWLQTDEPILWQRSRITVPKTQPLTTKIVNGAYNNFGFDMKPRVLTQGDRLVYELEFKNVPQIIPEQGMPPNAKVDPYILLTTFKSWQDIAAWWRSLYLDKTVADPPIRAKVDELIKGKPTPEAKTRALYNFVAQEIRYVAVEYGDAGYEPHKASEIFANKYGDCKDKAILLVAMLGVAGIEAYPVLISTWDSLDVQEDAPALAFNHAIVALPDKEGLVFMDPTGSTVSFGDLPSDDQDRLTLVFYNKGAALERTPLFPATANNLTTRMTIKVADDESITGSRTVEATGGYLQAQRYWLKYTMPKLIEESLKTKVRSFADNATLTDYRIGGVDDLDAPVTLSFSFRAPQFFVPAGPIRMMDRLAGVDTGLVFSDERRYPLSQPNLTSETTVIEVELPKHLEVRYVPPAVSENTPWYFYSATYSVVGKKTLRFESVRQTKVREIPVGDYAAFKKSFEAIASRLDQQVVLETMGEG